MSKPFTNHVIDSILAEAFLAAGSFNYIVLVRFVEDLVPSLDVNSLATSLRPRYGRQASMR